MHIKTFILAEVKIRKNTTTTGVLFYLFDVHMPQVANPHHNALEQVQTETKVRGVSAVHERA